MFSYKRIKSEIKTVLIKVANSVTDKVRIKVISNQEVSLTLMYAYMALLSLVSS